MSQRHVDIMMIIAIQCDSLCTNCLFLKTGLVDHIADTNNAFKCKWTFSGSISWNQLVSAMAIWKFSHGCGEILQFCFLWLRYGYFVVSVKIEVPQTREVNMEDRDPNHMLEYVQVCIHLKIVLTFWKRG